MIMMMPLNANQGLRETYTLFRSLLHRNAITRLINANFWHAISRLKLSPSDRGAEWFPALRGSGLLHSVSDNQAYYFNYKIIVNMQRNDEFLDCSRGSRSEADA